MWGIEPSNDLRAHKTAPRNHIDTVCSLFRFKFQLLAFCNLSAKVLLCNDVMLSACI